MIFKEKVIKICKDAKLVGSSLVVVEGERLIDEVNYGYQSLATKELVTSETIFRIASISKIIVAMSLMTLVDEGKATINDDIGDILGFRVRNPYHPDVKITIKMLMTQTSSITDGYDEKGYDSVNGTNKIVSLEELLVPNEGRYYTPLTWDENPPGTKFIYSNFGCGILACIVESLTGELFTDFVERRILKPLNMDASFRACNIINKDRIADTYNITNDDDLYKPTRTKDQFINSCYQIFDLKNNFRGPAGGLFISMKDLSKIVSIFVNKGKYQNTQILKKSTVDLMLELHWYGYGNIYDAYRAKGLQLKFFEFKDNMFKGHTGSAYGVISYLFFNLETKLGICFITNGGYYKVGEYPGMYDVEEDTFDVFFETYFPKNLKQIFSFKIGEKTGEVDNRVINFKLEPFIKNDQIYMSINDLIDGLNILPKIEDDKIEIKKNKLSIEINKNDFLVNVNEVVSKLNMKIMVNSNNIDIVY